MGLTDAPARSILYSVSTQIETLWRRSALQCELVFNLKHSARVVLWLGAQLVFEQAVSSYAEALILADQLKAAFGA